MGEAKRKKQQRIVWPNAESYREIIDLHTLPSISTIDGARICELTGDDTIPAATQVILRAFKAVSGERTFHVGFCLGDGETFSAIGIAVIDRLMMEAPGLLHVVPIAHEDIAWDIVLRHLRSFTGKALLFAFHNSDIYDAGTAEISYSKDIRQFDEDGIQLARLTDIVSASKRRQFSTVRHRRDSIRHPASRRKIRHGSFASARLQERSSVQRCGMAAATMLMRCPRRSRDGSAARISPLCRWIARLASTDVLPST